MHTGQPFSNTSENAATLLGPKVPALTRRRINRSTFAAFLSRVAAVSRIVRIPFLSRLSRVKRRSIARGKVTFDRSRWNVQSSAAIIYHSRCGLASLSERATSFYAFARFKEIYPLWIMPRFPVRWRASRVQYLRPLSSFHASGQRGDRIVIVIEARGSSSSSSSTRSPPLLSLCRDAPASTMFSASPVCTYYLDRSMVPTCFDKATFPRFF